MSEAAQRLLELLRARAYKEGTFTLASGKQSDFFIDCKAAMLTAQGHRDVGLALLHALRAWESSAAPVGFVAGVELGGCPLASAAALTSALEGAPLDALYVRKEPKDHGTKKRVEGVAPQGARVALLEDVLTTGKSSLAAVTALREEGFEVPVVLALVDREEGGAQALAAAGVAVRSLFRRGDFVGRRSP